MSEPGPPTFAQTLEYLMATRGLSQAKLAEALGVYDGNVRRWRTGKGIEIENVWKIADFFGVDRGHLAQLAGYPDNTRAITTDSVDPQIDAMLDAERAQTHDDLRGIPPKFWPTILEARRAAHRTAVEMARLAVNGPISTAQSEPINPPAQSPADLSKRVARRRRRGLTIDLGLSAA
jgi:transcriptional regulator with XRE-family HTH domain